MSIIVFKKPPPLLFLPLPLPLLSPSLLPLLSPPPSLPLPSSLSPSLSLPPSPSPQSLNQYVLLECLDILGDMVHSHGTVLTSYHQELLHSLLPMLMDPRPISVRKRACTALCEYL